MNQDQDSRLPVALGSAADAGPNDCVLDLPAPSRHAIGCACCGARDTLALALARTHLALVRGERPAFTRVLVVGPATAAARVAAVLAADPVTRARFRAADPILPDAPSRGDALPDAVPSGGPDTNGL